MNETRRSTAKVAFNLAVFSATAATTFFAVRWVLQHPNAGRTIAMRTNLAIKDIAHTRSDRWRIVADNAATRYNELRNITT